MAGGGSPFLSGARPAVPDGSGFRAGHPGTGPARPAQIGSPSSLDFHRILAHTADMLKRVQVALAVVLVTLAGVIGWQGLRLREPVYEGRRLSDWLNAYRMYGLPGIETWQVRVEQ